MTTPSAEPICVRNSLLQHILLGRRNLFDGERDQRQLTKDGLIDALLVLYDDCCIDITKKDIHTVNFVDRYQPVVTKLRKLRVNVTDFEQKKVIGRGHFGEVHLAKEKQTGDVYAMKIIKKADTLAKHNIAFYEEEKDIMAKAKSEWLTSLHCSFQDQENLYLVMEFHPGGDLLSLLGRRDGTLTEDEARFYLAEMVLALHTLHSMGYVHRDIKPENVLLDRLGHIKLADFGSAAKLDSSGFVRNEMAVGTADYIAPEVLTSMNNVGMLAGGYGVECDYWSLGIMAYEMVFGSTPFGAEKMSTTYGNIMNFKNSFKFPASNNASSEFCSLISGLLCDAKTRLGYQKLLKHPFFASIDWNGLREKSPPYVPVITSLDDTSNFEDFENETIKPHSTVNLRNTSGVSGRNLPFIGFTYVKEASPVGHVELTSSVQFQKKIAELESELVTKTKEISELRMQKLQFEQEKSKQWNADLMSQKINRLELERDTLEKQLVRAQKDAEQHRRALEFETSERLKNEAKVVEMMKDMKRNLEKAAEKNQQGLRNEIQVWKQANSDNESRVKELEELLRTSMQALKKLEEDCDNWKAKSRNYKELAARGHRVGEKRASICPTPLNEMLTQTQQQLDRERAQKTELKEKFEELEERLRNSEAEFKLRLEEEEQRWVTVSTDRESEFQAKIVDLEERILQQKENRIKELENNLKTQLTECQHLRERSEQLQRSLEDTLQWKTGFETSFCVREGELESRIKQLEADLRSTTDMKLDLQKKVADISQREATNLQKYETMMVDMQQAVERLAQKNQELLSQQSSFESSNSKSSAAEVDEMKQKIVFLEEQIAKLEQQLEKTRENLTLEREKARQVQSDLWKKEKELSDAKIDLRIANRETKTSENENSKLKEEAKLWEGKLKAKDEEMNSLRAEISRTKDEVVELQKVISSKEKAQVDYEKNAEEAKKAVSSARELRRELQFVKDELAISQRLKTSLESEIQRSEERIGRHNAEKKEIQLLLEEEKKKMEAAEKDITVLKETMTIMDEQLRAFDNIVEKSDEKQCEFEKEKSQLNKEIERLKQEIRTAKQQVNEEKSLKLFTESRLRDVESQLKTCETDVESRVTLLQKQNSEYSTTISQLTVQVGELDQQLAEAELSISNLERRVNELDEENVKLQEESTALRTQLISVKNSNAILSEGLEQALTKAEGYKTKITQLEAQMETTNVMYKERELKYESTIGQQTKLIDFLQTKAEQSKKKPTLTDKLFGSHKKENQPSIPVGYRELESNLEKKTAQCRNLTEQLNKCKAEIALYKAESSNSGKSSSAKDLTKTPTAGHDMPIKSLSATPIAHRALSRLTQSPGTQQSSPSTSSIGLASQRMHHNIPHRLQTQMIMRATNCAVCLDSIHFGRQVSVCQDCGASAHAKCASHLPSTCGLPVGLAEHFGNFIGQETNNQQGDNTPASSSAVKGWVKIPRPGKANCWERKFMKLQETRLCIYDHEPSSDSMQPTDSFDLLPNDGSTVAIHSAVAQSEVFAAAKTDVPYMFMVESIPQTTCWPGRTLTVLALSFQQKKAWVSALEAVTQGENSRQSAIQAHRKPKLVLRLEDPLDVNCVVPISEGVLLIGAKEGLFSYRRNRKGLVKIEGVTNVHQIVVVPKLCAVLMIVGVERQLVMTELRVLQGCADTIQCAQPTLEVEVIPHCEGCHLFEASKLEKDDIFLCAATQDRVKLFKWNSNNTSFILRKELIVSETCSCIHFTEHSVLVGCDRIYEVDLGNYSAEEFLDASDSTLAYVVFGLKQLHSFPIAILDVTPRKGETEFLLCYHEFGVFVDGYGRRSRSQDVKWTRLPTAFAYRGPYLFVLHFNSVEVMRLTSTSFKAKSENSGPDDSDMSQESVAPPPSIFIDMPSPRFLGPAPEHGSNYFFSNDNKLMDILLVEAPVALGEKDGVQPIHLDDVSISGSEFSITPSIAQILDRSDESADCSSSPSSIAFKRIPSTSETNSKSKRVKFESDL